MQVWTVDPIVGENNSEMRIRAVVSKSAAGEMIFRDKLNDLDASIKPWDFLKDYQANAGSGLRG